MDPAVSNAFMDEALDDMTNALLAQGILLGPPKRFMGHDLPKDHLFTRENILSMRKAAEKESRRGRFKHPRRDNRTFGRLSPARAGRRPRTGQCPWRQPR